MTGEQLLEYLGIPFETEQQIKERTRHLRDNGCPYIEIVKPYVYPLGAVRGWVEQMTVRR
ncbi:MAG: hypothetical protein AAFV77_08315 [Planctomycetota bacterium]